VHLVGALAARAAQFDGRLDSRTGARLRHLMAKKKQSIGPTLGGVIVGLDYMIFRTGKPPAEQVESAKPIKPVAADGGGTLSIDLPDVPSPGSPGGRPENAEGS